MTTSFSTELLQRQNKQLREENDELRETVRQLRARLDPDRSELPRWLPHLTRLEQRFLIALGTGRLMSKERLHDQIYGDDPDGGPELKIVDVFICKLRKKLTPYGVAIETIWGRGYRMTAQTKARVQALIAADRGDDGQMARAS